MAMIWRMVLAEIGEYKTRMGVAMFCRGHIRGLGNEDLPKSGFACVKQF
jgi:hypothetical protein